MPVIPVLLEQVRGRLRDKSSLVRKAGLQLLATLLSKNPYSAKVNLCPVLIFHIIFFYLIITILISAIGRCSISLYHYITNTPSHHCYIKPPLHHLYRIVTGHYTITSSLHHCYTSIHHCIISISLHYHYIMKVWSWVWPMQFLVDEQYSW